jgi:meiotically up-regulated gene 157 (Mug157) protein
MNSYVFLFHAGLWIKENLIICDVTSEDLWIFIIIDDYANQFLEIWTEDNSNTDIDDFTSKKSVSFTRKHAHIRYFCLTFSLVFDIFPHIGTEMQFNSKLTPCFKCELFQRDLFQVTETLRIRYVFLFAQSNAKSMSMVIPDFFLLVREIISQIMCHIWVLQNPKVKQQVAKFEDPWSSLKMSFQYRAF